MSQTGNTEIEEVTSVVDLEDSLLKDPVVARALELLKTQLPYNLFYHTSDHTEDVIRETVLFAAQDGLDIEDIRLLVIAAAFHDTGFIQQRSQNEPIAAAFARTAMEQDGRFSEDQISLVETMIIDTQLIETAKGLRQQPSHDLSCYLLDGDLSNFGRDDFFERGELQRKEIGQEKIPFLELTLVLLESHSWLTPAARKMRQEKKEDNIRKTREMLHELTGIHEAVSTVPLQNERLEVLARLPLLLNSSLETRSVIKVALEHLKKIVDAEASSVFLKGSAEGELVFWALQGGSTSKLEGIKMPAGKGVVGWVISNQQPALIVDAKKDPRFFTQIDKESGFQTKSIICVPLIVRRSECIGAVQVINRRGDTEFTAEDLQFVEQFSNQLALAIENARLFESLTTRNKKLEILDTRKSEMLTFITHELRTPLNIIQTSADLIGSGMLQDQASLQKISGTLMSGVQRLSRLSSQLRNATLIDNGKMQLQVGSIAVPEMLALLTKTYEPVASKRKLLLKISPPANVKLVQGDSILIPIVLSNLLSNAIRFTPDGGSITLLVKKRAGLVEFEVKDTGIGIDSSQFAVIFEKFYEIKSALEHSSGSFEFGSSGLGLGLATARAILDAHGSSLEVKSELTKGSTFSFSLPAV